MAREWEKKSLKQIAIVGVYETQAPRLRFVFTIKASELRICLHSRSFPACTRLNCFMSKSISFEKKFLRVEKSTIKCHNVQEQLSTKKLAAVSYSIVLLLLFSPPPLAHDAIDQTKRCNKTVSTTTIRAFCAAYRRGAGWLVGKRRKEKVYDWNYSICKKRQHYESQGAEKTFSFATLAVGEGESKEHENFHAQFLRKGALRGGKANLIHFNSSISREW